MTSYKDYIAYFEGLADQYLANTPTNKTFYRKGLDEFLSSLTVDGNYPCMLLQKYDFQYINNVADSTQKKRTIAFIIFDHIDDITDFDAQDTAFDNCEIIIDKIYNKIKADITNPIWTDFVQYADYKSIQVTPVENPSDGNYGYFITVDIYSHHNVSVV